MLTYNELKEIIDNLSSEQRECNVSVFIENQDEYFNIDSVRIVSETDVLDKNHPILVHSI